MSVEPSEMREEVVEFEESPELAYALAQLARKAAERVSRELVRPILERVGALRARLNVRELGVGGEGDNHIVAAVDSTWTLPPLDLVIGSLALVATGYVIVGPSGVGSYGLTHLTMRVGAGEEAFSMSVELTSKVQELLAALRLLERHRYVEYVMLDGSLFFSTRPEFFAPKIVPDVSEEKRRISGPKLASLASSALLKLLAEAKRAGVPIVGVVKRVSSRFLLPAALEIDDHLARALRRSNDKFVMSYVLRPGEYAVLGDYLSLLMGYLEAVGAFTRGEERRRIERVLEILRSAGKGSGEAADLLHLMKSTSVVFYKPREGTLYPQAIRIDVYPADRAEEVVRYCMNNTTQNSVPLPIDYVDRFVRLETKAMRRFYSLVKAYSDAMSLPALGLTNPQKSYLYEGRG